jgi:hypothetical protein
MVGRMGVPVIPLLIDFLSAYRLTRLITADSILDGPRDAVVRWSYLRHPEPKHNPDAPDAWSPKGWAEFAQDDPDAPRLATLATCRWCMGWHCAVLVVVARRLFPRAWPPIAEALALSAGAALLAGLED